MPGLSGEGLGNEGRTAAAHFGRAAEAGSESIAEAAMEEHPVEAGGARFGAGSFDGALSSLSAFKVGTVFL
jgi:hypothetical protein